MVKQVGLLPAGCQPWNRDVCAAKSNRFAYSATLAIYIYELDVRYNQFRLQSIMSEHKKTISAIAWNPRNPNVLASSSFENKVIIWDVTKQKQIARLENTKVTPVTIGWSLLYGESLSFIHGRGPLFMWDYKGKDNTNLTSIKDTSFSSDVTCFRWHPRQLEKVAFGHQDGSVSFCTVGSKTQKHVLRPELDDDDDDDVNNSVLILEWDPLSVDYLLVSNAYSGVRMVDSVSHSVINVFQLPSAAAKIRAFSWMANAPGMFVTGDHHTGILRVWNVSKSSPVENIRVKKDGFHALQVICDNRSFNTYSHVGNHSSSAMSSTSQAQSPSMVTSTHFALPPAQIVCTFKDGGVGLYDLGRRKWDFLRDEGHIETIFDCKFSPYSSNILATSSFDGTIKLWDINTFNCTHTSPGNEGVIYSISWAPSDLNCIVAATSKSGLFIWDISKGRIVKRFTEHGKYSVYNVSWNHKDSKRIMSAGGDGYCIIRHVNGEVVQKYKHPSGVYGCDWSPHNNLLNSCICKIQSDQAQAIMKVPWWPTQSWFPLMLKMDMLATGCDDKNVRVYYTATSPDQPLKVFSGHTAKVFHVKWSPLKENLLCSGSDDGYIRVWDYSQDACIATLSGHQGPVRGLLWNTEIPYMVVSGSWDATMRIWDIRYSKCLDIIMDHGADVYGLTCHPSRPFIMASSSRDSTVRLWSLTTLTQPIEMNILAGRPWIQILGSAESSLVPETAAVLTGRASKEVKMESEEFSADARNRTLRLFSKFFLAPAGTDNLWELVSVTKGLDESLLSEKYGQGIVHVKHMSKFCCSEAQQLEMARLSKSGGGIGSQSKEEKLRQAALLHMKTANLQRYCELMVEVGEWERALAIAPGVSMSYWKNLATRYASCLVNENQDLAAPYCTAIGDAHMLSEFYIGRGQIPDAVLTAQVSREGLFPHHVHAINSDSRNGWQASSDSNSDSELLHQNIDELADWHLSNGSPVLSACCYLAIDDTKMAMSRLLQGHELELAVSAGLVLGNLEEYTSVALEMLSRRCERHGNWELALDLLNLIPDNLVLKAKCCARWTGDQQLLNIIHEKAGLPSIEDCHRKAEKLKRDGNILESVMYYLLSTSPELGLEIGLETVKSMISSGSWCVDDVFSMIQMLGCIRTDVLQPHGKKAELLTLCSYVGALMAIRRGYSAVVPALYKNARTLLQQNGYVDIGINESMMQSECVAWSVVNQAQPKGPVNVDLIPADYRPTYTRLMKIVGQESKTMCIGASCVASSHLPSHSDVHISCLTGERIQGLAHFFEDGRAAVSLNEALMWAKVNPFSPLMTGIRVNPF